MNFSGGALRNSPSDRKPCRPVAARSSGSWAVLSYHEASQSLHHAVEPVPRENPFANKVFSTIHLQNLAVDEISGSVPG